MVLTTSFSTGEGKKHSPFFPKRAKPAEKGTLTSLSHYLHRQRRWSRLLSVHRCHHLAVLLTAWRHHRASRHVLLSGRPPSSLKESRRAWLLTPSDPRTLVKSTCELGLLLPVRVLILLLVTCPFMATEKSRVYHERQRLQYCLLHTLNSLFQQKDAFSRASLNAISEKLALDDGSNSGATTWTPLSVVFKPHHNSLTGNYDINVLISALEEKGKTVVWHDRRNAASSIDLDAPEDVLMGIVINVSVRRFAGIWKSRHWIALRKINGVWYNLDSDLAAPQPFQDANQVREFLDFTIGHGGEVLLVMNVKPS
ncbi:hypothetical protein PIB30_037670 [Stylosanthes scabra]|uniref:ubiquitinyl hydrolase 1 n=1 Tax=Stylosanthes scabra TaxID=79078 RepID=A0ABU6UCG5_9FABA|nr:hypothetical protein [Stylosanthes scabra]